MAAQMLDDGPLAEDGATHLLSFLAATLKQPNVAYAEPPARIRGGYGTIIYNLSLAGLGSEWSRPLILRIFRPDVPASHAHFEAEVQNAVAGAGYPAPRVFHVCESIAPLGGSFLIMERLPGRIMIDYFFRPSPLFFRLTHVLAETQAKLHALDPALLSEASRVSWRPLTPESDLNLMQQRIKSASLDSLSSGYDWLIAHRPRDGSRTSICHGDFHPLNILMDQGRVSGVIDWSWVHVGDPAFDVGATIALFTQGPVELPGLLQGGVNALRRRMISSYYDAYRRLRPVDDSAVRYYEALRCFGFLIEAGEYRQAKRGAIERPLKPSAFTAPRQWRNITRRFRDLTGVAIEPA